MQNQHMLFLEETQHTSSSERGVILPPPKGNPARDVFAEAILDETSSHQRRSPLNWAVSLGIQIAVLAALLILPLYFTTGLDVQKVDLTFLALPPVGPPPPPLTASAAPRVVHSEPVHVYVPGKLTAPSFIPRVVAPTPSDATAPDVAAVAGGVAGGIPGGQLGGVIGGVLGGAMGNAPPPAPPVAEGPKQPVHVGGIVKAPRLLFGPDPVYPVLAKEARIAGQVVIEAIIDEHGNVVGEKAISGQPLLIPAALSAVAKRKYEPTVLDGEATPIDLRVEVTFSLGSVG
jgi:periplasmic protein TonB